MREPEITPEMVSAGVAVLDWIEGEVTTGFLAVEVYRAMALAAPSCAEIPIEVVEPSDNRGTAQPRQRHAAR